MKRAPPLATLSVLLALTAARAAQADVVDAESGRYLSKYPGLYSTLTLSSDARDTVFDAQGARRESVLPTYGAGNAFAERRAQMQFEWHSPWFETEAIPYVSSRLWTARARLGWAQLETTGPITQVIDAGPRLERKGDGLTDIELEFGPLLYGSKDWRTRTDTPLSVMLLAQAVLPTGQRNPDAPNNVGVTNAFGFGAKLGAHWRPLPRTYVDAGLGWRNYRKNEEPAFGAQEPSHRGDDWFYDLSVGVRLMRGVYAGASYFLREGRANTYEKVRLAAQPPATPPGFDSAPDPAAVQDGGTRDARAGASLRWFITPRLAATLHYLRPLEGRSGEFDLRYTRQLSGCAALMNCAPQDNGSAHIDGLGSARSYASDVWMLSLGWSYGQGDFWRREEAPPASSMAPENM